jgi:hypothetical protein
MRPRALSGLVLALAALTALGCNKPSSDATPATAPVPSAPGPTAAAPAATAAARRPKGADEKLAAADCEAIVEHLVEATWNEELASDPELKEASPAERETMRKATRTEALKDPEMKKIAKECRTELRGKHYECIMKAKTTKAIDACL